MRRSLLTLMMTMLLLPICLIAELQAQGERFVSAAYRHSNELIDNQTMGPVKVDLDAVLKKLRKEYQVFFTYSDKLVKGRQIVFQLDRNKALEQVLQDLLHPLGLQHEKVRGKTYVIVRRQSKNAAPRQNDHGLAQESSRPADRVPIAPMPVLASTQYAYVRPVLVPVTGVVTNEAGEPLIGVNILVQGTGTGTITDLDGRFSLDLPTGDEILVFSYAGYTTQEVAVAGRSRLEVTMVESALTLDEVVVVGYGTVKKSDLTGAVSSMRPEDMNPGANVSVDQLMVGRAAGVQINQTSSEPGGGLSVRIRGASSINAGNDPLYVIDGLPIDNSSLLSGNASLSGGGTVAGLGRNANPRNPLNALNPNDIESIEILKDASATAIYGSRGANGVILITTKKGRTGDVSVNYDVYGGTQSVYQKMDLLTAREYIDGINGISEDLGEGQVFSPSDISRIGDGTDWQDQIYRTAAIWNHNLSASGGDEKTTFFASLNYFDQEGVIKNSGIEKFIGRINLERSFSERARVGINFNSSLVKDNNNVDGININESAGPIYTALMYDPTEPIFNPDGSFTQSPNLTINNPLSLVEGVSSKTETNRTFGSIYFEYDVTSDLKARVNFGSDRQNSRRDIYNSTLTFNGEAAGGIANITDLERSNVLLEYTMTYNKAINENHQLNILGGVTYQDFISRGFSGTITTFPSDALGTNNLSLGNTGNDDLASFKARNTLLSYLGRVNYNLFNKYLFTASLRADGSSRFGENNKFGYFPSFALGWKLAEEAFIPEFFDDLKLRASWGQTGNQEIENYASLLTFGTGPTVVFNDQAFTSTAPSRIANPDLKWETTEQFNFGIDLSILSGRINATIDYFIKNTQDMLFNVPLPRTTGYGSILSNIGAMENRGFEFLINSTNVNSRNFSWSTSLNFSIIRNEVKDLGSVDEIVTGAIQDVGNTSIIRVGEPLAAYYGYEVTGFFQSADEIAGSAQPNARLGYPKFRDVNGDNAITPADQQIIGNPFPDFTFGFQNSFSYKGLQLDVFFQGQLGADLLNINVIESMYPANFRRNRMAEQVLDRWTPQNTDAAWPSGVNPFAYGGGKVHTLTLQDASYLRLRNVQLSYNIPVQSVRFLSSLRVYITGQNLLTITDYTGFDPEANAFGRSNVRIDYSSYPLASTWMFGVNVGF